MTLHLLDQFFSIDFYRRQFTSAAFWAPYVRQVCVRHGLTGEEITCGIPGSLPTFIIDRKQVIKFFGPLFDGAHAFEVERTIARWLRTEPVLPSATLLFEGRLDPPGARWDWPYLIFEYLPGESIGEAWEGLPDAAKIPLARQMGEWVRALHALPLQDGGLFRNRWDDFESFLTLQRTGCAERHRTWGSLPPRLVAEIDAFLPPVSELFDPRQRPHLIHADLTGDHLLGTMQDGGWTSAGVIDFGDARVGNLYYELPALYLDMLHADRRLLGVFLNAYGEQPQNGFARKALAYCLLHEFDIFNSETGKLPLVQEARSLDELASNLYGKSNSDLS